MFEHVELDMEPTQVPATPRITTWHVYNLEQKLLELIYLQSRVGIKKPTQKNPPKKTQKNPPKKTH